MLGCYQQEMAYSKLQYTTPYCLSLPACFVVFYRKISTYLSLTFHPNSKHTFLTYTYKANYNKSLFGRDFKSYPIYS